MQIAAVPLLCVALTACNATTKTAGKSKPRSKEYFAESEYGVKASPRMVAEGQRVPKGGGRYQVGKPYQVKGRWYTPKEDFAYNKSGVASWYGSAFHGRQTANGEIYDKYHLSAAHPTFPLPSYARVTNLENGSSVIVRVNDRGPFAHGRIIDVSSKTAELLDMKRKGTANVRVQYVGRARMDGHDMPYLMASYATKGDRTPRVAPEGQIATGVMVASADPAVTPGGNYASTGLEPSVLGQGVPVTALADVAQTPDGIAAFEDFVALPDVGPFPVERPNILMQQDGASFAAAYVEARVSDAETAFDAILADPDPLTKDKIVAFAKRRSAKP